MEQGKCKMYFGKLEHKNTTLPVTQLNKANSH
jgi:hypothetical protein